MRDLWLYVMRAYWRARLHHARDFAAQIEHTIVNERARAIEAVKYAETRFSRAQIEIIRARADATLKARA